MIRCFANCFVHCVNMTDLSGKLFVDLEKTVRCDTMVDLDLRASPYVCEMVPVHLK